MKTILRFYAGLTDAVNKVAVLISEFGIVILTGLIIYSSIARYFFNSPSINSTEISIYMCLLSTWLAAGYIHEEDRHVSIEFLSSRKGTFFETFSRVLSNVCIIIFSLVLMWAGFKVAETAYLKDYRTTTILRFPLWVTYSLPVIGGGLLLLSSIKKLFISSNKE